MTKISMTTLLSLLLFSFSTLGSSYLPHQKSDLSQYLSSNEQEIRLEVIAESGANWKQFSNFMGFENQWLWSSNESQSIYWWHESGYSELLVNFDAPIGTQYFISIGSCISTARIANKLDSFTLYAGNFDAVVKLEFSGDCYDGGVASAYFAKNVGLIQWTENTIAGPVSFQLQSAIVNNIKHPILNDLQVSARLNSGQLDAQTSAKAIAYLTLSNPTNHPISLEFNSGQKFEIKLLDSQNEVVNLWSKDRVFTQAIQSTVILPGKEKQFGDYIDLVDSYGFALPSGQYKLRLEVLAVPNIFLKNNARTNYAVEAPLYLK